MAKVTLLDGTEYDLSSPKGKHLRVLADVIVKGDNEMLSAFKMITILATPKLTLEQLDEMEGEDVLRLLDVVKNFRLSGSPSK